MYAQRLEAICIPCDQSESGLIFNRELDQIADKLEHKTVFARESLGRGYLETFGQRFR